MRNPLRIIAEFDVNRFDEFWPSMPHRLWLARCNYLIWEVGMQKIIFGHKRTYHRFMCAMVELDKTGRFIG